MYLFHNVNLYHSDKTWRGPWITACMLFLITMVVTFKLSSGAKWVSVALYETYITERRRWDRR